MDEIRIEIEQEEVEVPVVLDDGEVVVPVDLGSTEKINELVDFTVSAESADRAEVIKSGDIRNVRLHFLLPKGDKGERGAQGEKGAQGDRGEQGAKGDTGERGPKGETGAQGDRGPQGETGPIGRAFTYADFTAEQLAGLKGPKGDKGDQGQKGDTGRAFVYSDFTQAQLNALKGPQGPQGETGPVGPQGPRGEQGPQGESITGPQGPQGPKGDPGTIDERTQAQIVQDVLAEIPDWAKAATKPSYTASEVGARASNWMPTAADVGALPDTTVIPDAVTDAHINALIDAKLGGIENGTY